jgi:hypothetical protein
MSTKKEWLLAIMVIVGLTACATMQGGLKDIPLPNDINIVPPAPNLPKEIAAFSGKWEGTWDSGLDSILVVEEIHDTWAQVVFAHGDLRRYNYTANYERSKFKVISGPKPKIEAVPSIRDVSLISFEVKDSNTLIGSMTGSTWKRSVFMKRVN